MSHFPEHIGLVLTEVGPDRCSATLEVVEEVTQPYGIIHGGVYCAIAETVASTGAAVWAMEQGMAGCVGLNNSTDFLRATRRGVVTGVATPIQRGRTQQLWGVDMTRGDGKLVARAQVRLQNLTDPRAIGGFEVREIERIPPSSPPAAG